MFVVGLFVRLLIDHGELAKDASCRRARGQVAFHQLPCTALKSADSLAELREICQQQCAHLETTLAPDADRQNSCRCRPF